MHRGAWGRSRGPRLLLLVRRGADCARPALAIRDCHLLGLPHRREQEFGRSACAAPRLLARRHLSRPRPTTHEKQTAPSYPTGWLPRPLDRRDGPYQQQGALTSCKGPAALLVINTVRARLSGHSLSRLGTRNSRVQGLAGRSKVQWAPPSLLLIPPPSPLLSRPFCPCSCSEVPPCSAVQNPPLRPQIVKILTSCSTPGR
jgi:hypothetical protein